MSGFKIPSRNRAKKLDENQKEIVCPYCGKRFKVDKLTEDEYDEEGVLIEINDYYMYSNTMIIHCCDDFIPNSTRDITYIYSGHCKTKDKKFIKNIKNNS